MPTSENPHNRGNKNRKRPKYHFVKTYACETTRFTNYGIRSLFMNFFSSQDSTGSWLQSMAREFRTAYQYMEDIAPNARQKVIKKFNATICLNRTENSSGNPLTMMVLNKQEDVL